MLTLNFLEQFLSFLVLSLFRIFVIDRLFGIVLPNFHVIELDLTRDQRVAIPAI